MKLPHLKLFLFSLLFGIFLLPSFQKYFSVFTFKPLAGEYIPAMKQNFSIGGWLDGEFQKSFDKYYEENIGFRNPLIRIYNQVDFSLFKTVHGGSIEVGKKGYLFETPYLMAHAGKDFIGNEEIDARIERIKFVSKTLKERGISVIIAIAPTKADFFEEYIPSFYTLNDTAKTNYEVYRKKLVDKDILFVDFNNYFLKLKKTSPYPLYPKQGIHWSQYGMYLAADSLLNFMKEKTGINMKNLYCDGIELSSELRSTDYDLGDLSNVLFEMCHDSMPYPILRVEDNPAKSKPNVLVIGDSYYWNIYYTEIPGKIFNGANFWYYNHLVYTDSVPGKQKLDVASCMATVEKQQVIVILQTVSNLNKVGFGFFENMYGQLKNNYNILAHFEKLIRDNPQWLEAVTKKARERNISLEEMIRSDAQWMAEQEIAKQK